MGASFEILYSINLFGINSVMVSSTVIGNTVILLTDPKPFGKSGLDPFFMRKVSPGNNSPTFSWSEK